METTGTPQQLQGPQSGAQSLLLLVPPSFPVTHSDTLCSAVSVEVDSIVSEAPLLALVLLHPDRLLPAGGSCSSVPSRGLGHMSVGSTWT